MIRSLALRQLLSLFFVLVFLSFGVSGFIYLASKRKPPEAREAPEKSLNVEVFRIGSENIRQTLRGFGTVQADREVVLSAEVAGTIDRVHRDFEVGLSVMTRRYPEEQSPESRTGDPQVEGDELVVIDKERYLGQLKQITSQIEELEAEKSRIDDELDNARKVQELARRDHELIQADFARQKELHKNGILTLAELNRFELEAQTYQKTMTLANNEVNQAMQRSKLTERKIDTLKVQQKLAQDDLERTVIRPPFDGFLSEVFVEVGKYVTPGEPVARITNIERVVIPVSLTLDDYDKLKPQLVRKENPHVGLSLHEGEEPAWTGKVARIAPEANRQTRTITVFVEVENARQNVPLLPGTFVFARIAGPVYQAGRHAIIPRDAILRNRVFRVKEGLAEEVPIQVQERLQSIAIVRGELKTGDLLILTNLDMLAQDLPVEISIEEHLLKDELNPDEPWKCFWEILSPSNSTAGNQHVLPRRAAQSAKAEITD